MRIFWTILLTFSLVWSLNPAIAQATTCHTYYGHEICFRTLKRSAKYYWEYRAAVIFDQEHRPLEIYNCRTHQRTTKQGEMIPFVEHGPGEFICQFFSG